MKKILTIKLQLLFILTTFAFTPTIYAQRQKVSLQSIEKIVWNFDDQQKQVDFLSFIRTELFFGRNKPDGTEVSEEDFAAFLNDTITPEFPDGLTVLDGIGQFRDSGGNIIQEKAKVLILLYPSNTRRPSNRKIERIRKAYKNRFQQQSVLRVDDVLPVKVSF